jgi:hypothetical protein
MLHASLLLMFECFITTDVLDSPHERCERGWWIRMLPSGDANKESGLLVKSPQAWLIAKRVCNSGPLISWGLSTVRMGETTKNVGGRRMRLGSFVEETLLVTTIPRGDWTCRCTCDATTPRLYNQPFRRRTSQSGAHPMLLVVLCNCANVTVPMPFEM